MDKVGCTRLLLRVPFDHKLFNELKLERYDLSKSGKLLFNHPQGTHDDRFWAVALAVYSAEQAPPPPSRAHRKGNITINHN